MRKPKLTVLAALSLSCVPAAPERAVRPERLKAKDGVPEIADITSLADLRRADPVKLENGWEVRLGIADSGEDGGPWRLIYCLARYRGDDPDPRLRAKRGSVYGEALGPVSYSVTPSKDLRAVPQMYELLEPAVAQEAQNLMRERLFCGNVVTSWKGTFYACVYSPSGEKIARKEIVVHKPRPCYWQEFAESNGNHVERLSRPGENSRFRARRQAGPAAPEYDGAHPLPYIQADGTFTYRGMAGGAIREEETCLPAMLAPGFGWEPWYFGHRPLEAPAAVPTILPLSLSLEGKTFAIKAHVEMMDWADENLLARWWVNGSPVEALGSPGSSTAHGRQVARTKEMRVAFGLPENLGELQAGDRIGLQVLYSPSGYQHVSYEPPWSVYLANRPAPPSGAVPLLSNRLGFTLTEDR